MRVLEQARRDGLTQTSGLPSVRALARQYGVSPATVARAFKEMIKDGICYSVPGKGVFLAQDPPNPEEASTTIGVVFGYEGYAEEYNPFYRELYQGVERQAVVGRHNLLSLFHWSRKNAGQKNRELEQFRDAVSGFIALGLYYDADLIRLRDTGSPVVALDYDARLLGIDSVVIENADAMTSLTEAVLGKTSGSVLYADLARKKAVDPSIVERREAFGRVVKAAGRRNLGEMAVPGSEASDPEALAPLLRSVREDGDSPAVVCADDNLALMLVRRANAFDLMPGRDFSLAYLGPLRPRNAMQPYPALVAAVEFEAIGRNGVEMLEGRLEKGAGKAECRKLEAQVLEYVPD